VSLWRRLTGGLAAFIGAMLWSPVVMFMVWLPRLNYPDTLAYGVAALFVVALTVIGVRRPKLGGAMLAVVSISWVGLCLLLFLEVLEVA
jgi:hypothetical protein